MANYVDIDPTLEKAIRALQGKLDEDDWMVPQLVGDLEDPSVIAAALSPASLNVAVAKAISDPKSPGTDADTTVGPIQVDLLQSMQRALLLRHCYPWNRCLLLAEGRDKAQAKPQGPLASPLEYLQAVIKQSKGEGQA